ncbi:zinc finger and SCAN domain-containing protein 21-like isoform X2 [Melanotaenia boesemani]|uniref:zinc finger and SCAN domain-containing protein 21-like isoform X2 n=1 Tax=Melanotaenia boesemani TaxID=1250792 RepID=UPI001C0499CB|nr:zinc finger and SCAN domain-containing protein 21-like isoform X2 [Melanotaenia boesemani]
MSSTQYFRELISERLTAAAEEILTEFEKTIVQYEEAMDRQRRLLETSRRPKRNPRKREPRRQHVHTKQKILSDQSIWNHKRNSSLDQQKPKPIQIPVNQDKVCLSPEVPQFVLTRKTDSFVKLQSRPKPEIRISPSPVVQYQYKNGSLDQPALKPLQTPVEQDEVFISQEEKQQILKKKSDSFMMLPTKTKSQKPIIPRYVVQKSTSSLDQQNPKPLQIQELDKVCISQEEKQFVLKLTDSLMMLQSQPKSEEPVIPIPVVQYQESTSSLDQQNPNPLQVPQKRDEACISQEAKQLVIKLTDSLMMLQSQSISEEPVIPIHVIQYQESTSSLDQQNPNPLQVPEEQDKICISEEEKQFVLKLTESLMMLQSQSTSEEPVIPIHVVQYQETSSSLDQQDPNPLQKRDEACISQEREQPKLKSEEPVIPIHVVQYQETSSSLDQQDPNPLQKRDEACISQEREQPKLKSEEPVIPIHVVQYQETSSSLDQQDPNPLQKRDEACISQEREQPKLKSEEPVTARHDVRFLREMDPHHRLMDVTWQPMVKLHRIELPEQRVGGEDISGQQSCGKESNCSLDQEDLQPPPTEEKLNEQCFSQDGKQLVQKQSDARIVTPAYKENGQSEPEQNRDQLFSLNSPSAESQKQGRRKRHMTTNPDAKVNRSLPENICMTDKGKNSEARDTWAKTEKKKLLQKHQRILDCEKPHPCETCGKRYSHLPAFKAHLTGHVRRRNLHPCRYCEKAFKHPSLLKFHMRTHTIEKPYSCKVCHKDFCSSNALNTHMRTHTAEKPYSCTVCQETFAWHSSLVDHMRTHTTQTPYSCKICGTGLCSNESLRFHIASHTDEKFT